MPYFLKLSDFFNENSEKCIDLFLFSLVEFSGGCQIVKKNVNEEATFILFYIKPKKIKRANEIYKYKNELEYYTYESIPKESIIDNSDFFCSYEEAQEMQEAFFNDDHNNYKINMLVNILNLYNENLQYNIFKNSYIHITCKSNVNSILSNGLFAEYEILPQNKIGDRIYDYEEEEEDYENNDEDYENDDEEEEDIQKEFGGKNKNKLLKKEKKQINIVC